MAETQTGAMDWLFQPISEAAPCGPNMEAEGMNGFLDYYYEAEARLPERYVTPGMGGIAGGMDQVFDPKSVNLRAETQAISGLLRQSRDLRLLSLLARFQILAGRLADFAETLELTAQLLAQWTDDIHPQLAGALPDRRAALDELGSIKTVVMPLQYLPLAGQAEATYRRAMVATGQASPRESEAGVERGSILSALTAPSQQKQVERLHGDLGRSAKALSRIVEICAAHPTARFRPAVDETIKVLTGMQELLREAHPHLVIWSSEPDAVHLVDHEVDAGQTMDADVAASPASVAAAPQPISATAAAGVIADRAGVRAALEAAERFLAQNEPSSPALLLVTQARLLVGRPLIEALETLLPTDAARAVIGFAPETGFAMSMERMKKLSDSALGGFDEPAGSAENGGSAAEPAQLPALTRRQEVAAQLRAVEDFYALREPASPIPILLARARAFMDKGFQAIVAELLAKAEPRG